MTNGEEDFKELVGRELGDITNGRPRYVLEEYLDKGGYGAVYRGTDRRLDLIVAIKVGFSSREFMREARLAAAVQHNHIVKVNDFGYDPEKGLAFLVMEYLHGEDLGKLFQKQGNKLTTDQLIKFVEEVGGALAYAHNENLIHRDLKPQNIILTERPSKTGTTTSNSKFVLLDFGIASRLDTEGTQRNKTQDGAGTIEYMAPEFLFKSPKPTPQSDIYAFGLILYQMITGHLPFPQADGSLMAQTECLTAISKQPPPSFLDIAPDRTYPLGLEEVVLQCLKKDPAERPQTMVEVCKSIVEIFHRSLDSDAFDAVPNPEAMPENPQNLVGRVLDNRYVLEKFIDRGGYGAVYEGTDRKFGASIAIKVGLSSREFKKEAQLAAEVKHPNIVKVSDFGSDKGLAYLVMDYLHGETLEQLFEKQGRRLTPEQLRRFVNEIGDALASAHDHLLIHRDLKPRNVILNENIRRSATTTQQSRFVLFDFGIAAKIDAKGTLKNITQNGAGSIEYMAPELFGNDPQPTPQSDIYAFGVILYQMMLGRVPFPQSDVSHLALVECVKAVASEKPSRFRDVAPNRKYPRKMEDLVLQCLEKLPDRRPQTMAEVKERFLKIQDEVLTPLQPQPSRRPPIDSRGTLNPNDMPRVGEDDDNSTILPAPPPISTPIPTQGTLSKILLPLALLIVVSFFGAKLLFPPITSASYSLMSDLGPIEEGSTQELIAGQSVTLTFSVTTGEAKSPPEFKITSKPEFVTIKQEDSSIPGSKRFVISAPDLNMAVTESPSIVLSAIQAGKTSPFRRTFKLRIKRPDPWLPEGLKGLGFREAKNSTLYDIGGIAYTAILSREIGGREVRFRLIPSITVEESGALVKIPSFYMMENLVSNDLFAEFAQRNPDFEREERKSPEDRSWTKSTLSESPVTEIDVLEALQFAWCLSGRDYGKLPSKSEWLAAAGYYDFKKDPEFVMKIANEDPEFHTHPLGVKAWFGKGPASGQFQEPNGMLLRQVSPYGCKYGSVAEEFTRTVVDQDGMAAKDLLEFFPNSQRIPLRSELLKSPKFNESHVAVCSAQKLHGEEVTYDYMDGPQFLKSINLFSNIDHQNDAAFPDIGFRVVLSVHSNSR